MPASAPDPDHIGMDERDETVVAEPALARWIWWVGFPLLGAVAGWLLLRAVDWAISLPQAPLPGPLRLLASLPEPPATAVAIILGILAGLALALQTERESLTVTVSGGLVRMARGERTTAVAGGQISGAFLDGKRLVLVGHTGEELAREPSDLDRDQLREAFLAYGYAWHADGDPHRHDFRRWVADAPEVPGAANALLKARERALARNDHEDAAELRAELAKLGIVVREEQTRQYWRTHSGPPR
jgi:hypothetical protein